MLTNTDDKVTSCPKGMEFQVQGWAGHEGSTLSQQIRALGTEPNVYIRLQTEFLLRTELRCKHSYFHYQNTGRVFSAAGT
jgi:hypothetical protein